VPPLNPPLNCTIDCVLLLRKVTTSSASVKCIACDIAYHGETLYRSCTRVSATCIVARYADGHMLLHFSPLIQKGMCPACVPRSND